MDTSLSDSISVAVSGFTTTNQGESNAAIGGEVTTASGQQTDTALDELHVEFQAENSSAHTVTQGALVGNATSQQQGQHSVKPKVQLIPIHVDILNRWRHLGATKGLLSDTQIASYLLQHYDNTLNSLSSSPRCANCHVALPLPLYCSKCNPPADSLNAAAVSFTSSENSSLASAMMTTVSASLPCFPTNTLQGSYQFSPLMDPHNAPVMLHSTEQNIDSKDFSLAGKKLRPVNLKKKRKGKKFKGKRGDYTCRECGTHISPTPRQRRRAGFKPYKCSECGAAFAYRRMLEHHLFQKQDGSEVQGQAHKCLHCGLVVVNSCDMRNHTLKHTAEMPYKCPHCPLAFSLACNLKTHLRTHTGERPFSCTVCGRAFSQSIALKVHMRKHTGEKPFKCELCDMAFAASSNLSRHMLKHTGEKPYKCQYCVAAFSQPGSLKTHTRKHTGERPYKCDACGAAFSDHSTLWKHKRKNSCAFSTNSARVKKAVEPQQAIVHQTPQPPSQQPQPPPPQAMQAQVPTMPMSVGPMVTTTQGHQQLYRPQPVEEAPYMSSVGWCFPMQQQQ